MEKGIFVKDIKRGSLVSGLFAIQAASLNQTRRGEPYWTLTLVDVTGAIEARIWAPLSSSFREIPLGGLARITGRSEEFRGSTQLSLERFDLLDSYEVEETNPADFMPSSPYDPREMFASLRNVWNMEFTHEPWRRFIEAIFSDGSIANEFLIMPAARNVHHAYAGGLLEHTLGVFELCRILCDRYPQLDRQTLLAGALLHDIGKIREFSGGIANDYTQEGRMLGHIFLGLEMIRPFMEQSSLEAPLQEHLKHLILSHHGLPEYGAARIPCTAEAFALHYADNLDAKLAQCRSLFNGDEKRPVWSGWQKTLDRAILLPVATPNGRHGEKDEPIPSQAYETEFASESRIMADEYEKDFLDSLADYPDEYAAFDAVSPEGDSCMNEAAPVSGKASAGEKNPRQDRQCSLL